MTWRAGRGRVARALVRAASPLLGTRRAPRGRGELRSPALTGASARQAAVPAPRGDRSCTLPVVGAQS
jgi:hypothetical protein